jgi:hypothetical protein
VSIIIISVLIALLLPAVGSARRNVYNARVRTEVGHLETAIADFKALYGVEPPSHIVLYEIATGDGTIAGAGWNTTISMGGTAEEIAGAEAERNESVASIRELWQQFNHDLDRDLNGDGDMTDIHVLSGTECLVFFLGGMFEDGAPNGFSKNPANPFATGGQREGPFFDFDTGRFVNIDNDAVVEYVDTFAGQRMPYLYFSSNDGQGYLPLGKDAAYGFEGVDDDAAGMTDVIEELGLGDDHVLRDAAANAPTIQDVYRQSTDGAAWKPKSFQIISPGPDAVYGIGGIYTPDTAQADLVGNRSGERDNITNFEDGPLAP